MPIADNIFQIRSITNAQTINTNRFSIRFEGLTTKLINTGAADSALGDRRPDLQDKYNILKDAWDNAPRAFEVNDGFTTSTTVLEDVLEISLFSASVPNVQIETQTLNRFNDGVKAPTRFAEMEDFTISFYDYVNGSASAAIQYWQAFVGNKHTGAIGFKTDYILPEAYFYMYGPDAPGSSDSNEARKRWIQAYSLVNIYPKQVNLGEHTMEGGEARKVEVIFNLDNIYPVGARSYVALEGGAADLSDINHELLSNIAPGVHGVENG